MPAPIQPSDAPYVSLSFEGVSPPKPPPIFGVNTQSARALAGPTTSMSAAIKAYFFTIAFLLNVQSTSSHNKATVGFLRPGEAASRVPGRSGELNETIELIELDGTSVSARERSRMVDQ